MTVIKEWRPATSTWEPVLAGSSSGAVPGVFNALDDGLAPASGGGIETFLRADGTWVVVTPASIDGGDAAGTGADSFDGGTAEGV